MRDLSHQPLTSLKCTFRIASRSEILIPPKGEFSGKSKEQETEH
jgi:hypothetical protein